MAGPRANSKAFAKAYRQRTRSLMELAGGFSEGLSPDAVHDLRVAARRVQTLCRLLPKTLRESEAYERFNDGLGSLLKATSPVRDLDTLTLTLQRIRPPLPAELLTTLCRQRDNAMLRAKPAIEAFSSTFPPAVDRGIDAKKLSRRLRKRIAERQRTVRKLLDAVLKDESHAEELHALRKETKKLRYLMELAEESPPELSALAAWQESLGGIRDIDVAIDYLRRSRLRFPRLDAVAELERSRHTKYSEFSEGSAYSPILY